MERKRKASDEALRKENAALLEKFNVEKDAKNTAYYFILSKGLYSDFAVFSRQYKKRGNDIMDDVRGELCRMAKNAKL